MKKRCLVILSCGLLMACGGGTDVEQSTVEAESMIIPEFEKDLLKKAQTFFQVLPDRVISEENPLTNEKIALGKSLYIDTRLSKDGKNSCNGCHDLASFGVDNDQFSEGDLGGLGGRNSPTTFNAALHGSQFWDGRANTVEEQAGMPILNPAEMNIPSEQFLIDRLKGIEEYRGMFSVAFPDEEDPITYKNLRFAIAAFERTLMTPSQFDNYLGGNEDALGDEEKKGLFEFIDVGCITCHIGPALGGTMLQKFGLYGNYWELTGSDPIDEGRFEVSGNEADKYFFKVPSLRNIEKTLPYFHDGSVTNLPETIKIMAKLQLNKDLSEEQVQSIETFLKALTGELTQ